MSKNSAVAGTEADKELPQGTTPAFARMHKWLKRFIIICLFGLVIEGAFTVPVLAIWYGAPTLSLTQICDEFMKVRWNDETADCKYPHPIDGPPFGGPGEGTAATPPRPNGASSPSPTSTASDSGNWCATRRNAKPAKRPRHRRVRSDTTVSGDRTEHRTGHRRGGAGRRRQGDPVRDRGSIAREIGRAHV